MSDRVHAPTETWSATLALRVALFAVAASLALYIPYKYATHLHAIEGLYALLFPLSGVLALAGIVLAVKPQTGCGCSEPMRAGVGVVAGLWMGTGLLCVPTLAATVQASPLGGMLATFHMLAQHVFLSSVLLAFAIAPSWTARTLGGTAPAMVVRPRSGCTAPT